MEQLIPVINKLQDAFAMLEGGSPIDLPQLVVIGSQSSGKSSVLENLVGRDFLPRGSNIVTRRPLILQLINIPKKSPSADSAVGAPDGIEFTEWGEDLEWGEFLHRPGEKMYDFTEIKQEIERETERLTGKNKGVSPIPINLKVCSQNVLNLTLVDLPGITKVPVGDQPKDIESQIRRMVMTYIEKPNTIILAVSSANSDLSNSDALQLARSVDPEGKRTIGIITKLDLMDQGTDAMDMLMGRVVPLRLGYIGVVNRSQKDINESKSITSALEAEKKFFATHPLYSKVMNRSGTQFMGQRCAQILMNHIRNCLPEMKQKIGSMIMQIHDALKALGENEYNVSPGAMLLQIINTFASSYSSMIEGKVSDEHSVESLYGGARVNYIFNDIYAQYLINLNPLDGLSSYDIQTAISNATGPKAALFVPESAFELLVRRQLGRFRDPAIQCVDLVYDELERIVNTIDSKELERYQNLREALNEAATELLRKCRSPTKDMIENIMASELNFINTNHPNFKVDSIVGTVMQKRQQALQQQPLPAPPGSNPNPPSQAQQLDRGRTSSQGAQPAKRTVPPPAAAQSPPGANDKSFFSLFFNKEKEEKANQPFSGFHSMDPPPPSSSSGQSSTRLKQPPTTLNVRSIPKERAFEIELLEGLLEAYFNIVRTNIVDAIPKAIMYFLVTKSKQEMQNTLVQHLYKDPERFEFLLSESPDIAARRKTCKETLVILEKAQSILNEVRDYRLTETSSIM